MKIKNIDFICRKCVVKSRLSYTKLIFFNLLLVYLYSPCRQGAALALSDCVRAYGAEFLETLAAEIRSGLATLSHQQSTPHPHHGRSR